MKQEYLDRIRIVAKQIAPDSYFPATQTEHGARIRAMIERDIVQRMETVAQKYPNLLNAPIGLHDTKARQDLRGFHAGNIPGMPEASTALSVVGFMPEDYDPSIFLSENSRLSKQVFPAQAPFLRFRRDMERDEQNSIRRELHSIACLIIRDKVQEAGLKADATAIRFWADLRRSGYKPSFDQVDLLLSARNDPSFPLVQVALRKGNAMGDEIMRLTAIDDTTHNNVIEKHYRKATMAPMKPVNDMLSPFIDTPEFQADMAKAKMSAPQVSAPDIHNIGPVEKGGGMLQRIFDYSHKPAPNLNRLKEHNMEMNVAETDREFFSKIRKISKELDAQPAPKVPLFGQERTGPRQTSLFKSRPEKTEDPENGSGPGF